MPETPKPSPSAEITAEITPAASAQAPEDAGNKQAEASEASREARETGDMEAEERQIDAEIDLSLFQHIEDETIRNNFKQKLAAAGYTLLKNLNSWKDKHNISFEKTETTPHITPEEIVAVAPRISVDYANAQSLWNDTVLKDNLGRQIDKLINEQRSLPRLSENAKNDLIEHLETYCKEVRDATAEAAAESAKKTNLSKMTAEEHEIYNKYEGALSFNRDGALEIDNTKLDTIIKASGDEEEGEREKVIAQLNAIRQKFETAGNKVAEEVKKVGIIAMIMDLIKKLQAWLEGAIAQFREKYGKSREKSPKKPREGITENSPVEGKIQVTEESTETALLAKTEPGKKLMAPSKGKVLRTGEEESYGGNYIEFETAGKKIIFGGVQKTALPDAGKEFAAGEIISQTGETLHIEVSDAKTESKENPKIFFKDYYETYGTS